VASVRSRGGTPLGAAARQSPSGSRSEGGVRGGAPVGVAARVGSGGRAQ